LRRRLMRVWGRGMILGWESVLFMLEKTVVFVENDLSIEFDRI
jgi:hypothetical protein